jgi:predicted PhzF superfamily epimerase YddE/YHI9
MAGGDDAAVDGRGMSVSIACVDAFTDRAFAGNPAAVCLLDGPRDAVWMQQLAAEMNLAETAFVLREPGGFGLRWFTPAVEVDLCGHATLASAHTLWTDGIVPEGDAIEFRTRSGILGASWRDGMIELDFPSEPAAEAAAPPWLAEALGTVILWAGRNRMDVIVEVAGERELRGMTPDLAAIGKLDARGLIVTCHGGGTAYDFLSRFFAPQSGIDEDPVTGSAHCCLAPFWAARLKRTSLVGFQASPRGGEVRVTVNGPRVILGGRAVTIYSGTLRV